MKKVVLFCEYFGNGGIEKILDYLRKHINKDRYSLSILTTIFNSQLYDKVDIDVISNQKHGNFIYRFFKTSFYLKTKGIDASIIHLHIYSPIGLFYGYLLKNKNIIVHAHGSNFDGDFFRIKKVISFVFRKLFVCKSNVYVACSSSAALFCFGKGVDYILLENKFEQNRFLYDVEVRDAIRKQYEISADEILIGNVGCLRKQKNHSFLIQVFYEFQMRYPKSRLLIVGTGSEKKNLMLLIKDYDILDKVVFIDYIKDIEKFYQIIDFYVFPSKCEGYGITVNEALCCSLKCLVSNNIRDNFKDDSNIISLSLDNPMLWGDILYQNIGYERVRYDVSYDSYCKEIDKIYGGFYEKD